MNLSRIRSWIVQNGHFYALGLLLVLGLKYHYSRAGSEELCWILAPTVRLVEFVGRIHFEWEAGVGFISHAHRMIITPACAGINFLTIAFSTLFFSFAYRLEGRRRKLHWLGFSLAAAYLLTVGINGLRIGAAIVLYKADIYGGWVTPARVHRIEGTLIYFFFLTLLYFGGDRIVSHLKSSPASLAQGASTFFVPFFWYMLFALGIPTLNMIYRQNGHPFAEHCSTVIASCLSLLALLFAARLVYHKAANLLEGAGRSQEKKTNPYVQESR